MFLQTSRFGRVEVDEDRLIVFPKGVLGFASFKRFVLLQPDDEGCFLWLQSVDEPDLAFVVTDPSRFVPTYKVPLRNEQLQELGMNRLDEAQVLVIVNKHGTTLTGNLQGPLVISSTSRTGEQLVLSDRRYHTRVPLVELQERVAMSA